MQQSLLETQKKLGESIIHERNKYKEIEEKYRLLFAGMVDGFALHKIIVDKDNKPIDYVFLEVNSTFEKLTGLKNEDINGKKITELLPGIENDAADWIGKYGRVALTGEKVKFEGYSKNLNRWYNVSGCSPKKGYFIATFKDITERKKYEDEIDTLAIFLKENPFPVLRISEEGRILFGNTACSELLKSRYYAIGDLISEEDLRLVKGAIESGEIKHKEISCEDKVFYMWLLPIKNLKYVNVYGCDITDRKKAEQKLKKIEEKYFLAQKAACIGTWDWDIVNGKLTWSDTFESILGLKDENLSKTYETFLERIHPEDKNYVVTTINSCLQWKKEYKLEHRILCPDGKIKWISALADIIRDENSSPLRMLGVLQDISVIKEAEEMLKKVRKNRGISVFGRIKNVNIV